MIALLQLSLGIFHNGYVKKKANEEVQANC